MVRRGGEVEREEEGSPGGRTGGEFSRKLGGAK